MLDNLFTLFYDSSINSLRIVGVINLSRKRFGQDRAQIGAADENVGYLTHIYCVRFYCSINLI